MSKRYFLLIMLLLLHLPAWAAGSVRPLVKYTEYRSGEEMAHTRVACIHQDAQGFLWMGTWIGLCRYDGEEFQFFRSEPGNTNPQSHNRVTQIGELVDGRMWCRTYDQGLYFFDRSNCSFQQITDSTVLAAIGQRVPPAPRDWEMVDAIGITWQRRVDGELCWADPDDQEYHPVTEALASRYHGLLPIDEYHLLFADNQRNLWISAGTALFRLSMQPRQTELLALPMLGEVRALALDRPATAKLSSYIGCDTLLLGDKVGHLCRLLVTHDGLLQRGAPIEYMRPDGSWSTQPVRFCDKGIYALLRDRRSRLWIGTRGDGLYCLDGRLLSHYIYDAHEPLSIGSNDVYALMEDAHGTIWTANFEQGGLNRIDEGADGVTFANYRNAWSDYPAGAIDTRCLCEDGQGRILVGTNGGLLVHDPKLGSWRLWTHSADDPNSLPGNTVMSIMRNPSDKSIYQLSYGYGISRVQCVGDSLSFDYVTNRDYPAGDVAIAAQMDYQGRVWYGSECGFTCYTPGAAKPLQYYNGHDFDDDYIFTEMRPLALPSGIILMGMKGGILSFDGNRLHKSDAAPHILFTRYGFPNQEEPEHYVCDLKQLVVDPDHRTVSIRFSALDFQQSPLKRYAYRLVDEHGQGLSTQERNVGWTHTAVPEVNFVELPAGRYFLTVRSTNADGVWCDNDHVLEICVTPTFWETPWAWLVWGLLFVALASLIGYTAFYINRLEQRKMQLEAVLAQYTENRKAEDIVDQLPTPEVSTHDDLFMKELMQYLEAHMSESELSVADFAEAMNMSQATFYRKLKNYVGLSPVDFFRKVRMRRAVQLLQAGEESISQVAYQVGFSDPKYFSKCFKHDMGCTPGEYRQRQRESS